MPTAVIRVTVDPSGVLTDDAYRAGLNTLGSIGLDVVATQHLPQNVDQHEIELIVDDDGHGLTTEEHLQQCRAAFGVAPALGIITYISRGTEDDAHGVLARFGVRGTVVRTVENDEEIFTVSLSEGTEHRVAESRLHTALEAALNAEVRLTPAH